MMNFSRCGMGIVSHTTLMLSRSPFDRWLFDTPPVSNIAIGRFTYLKRAPFR